MTVVCATETVCEHLPALVPPAVRSRDSGPTKQRRRRQIGSALEHNIPDSENNFHKNHANFHKNQLFFFLSCPPKSRGLVAKKPGRYPAASPREVAPSLIENFPLLPRAPSCSRRPPSVQWLVRPSTICPTHISTLFRNTTGPFALWL